MKALVLWALGGALFVGTSAALTAHRGPQYWEDVRLGVGFGALFGILLALILGVAP